MEQLSIQLEREIGNLQSVSFQTKGSDGWLLSQIRCRMNSLWYEILSPTKWLQTIDPNQLNQPLDEVTLSTTTSNFELPVFSQYNDFTSVGLG